MAKKRRQLGGEGAAPLVPSSGSPETELQRAIGGEVIDYAAFGLPSEANIADLRRKMLEEEGFYKKPAARKKTLTEKERAAREKERRAKRAEYNRKRYEERRKKLQELEKEKGIPGLAPRPKAPKGTRTEEEKKALRKEYQKAYHKRQKGIRDWFEKSQKELQEKGFQLPEL